MKKYRLRIGLDVDDILYDCNGFALARLNAEEGIEPPLTIHDIKSWGEGDSLVDRRIRYFSDPDFVREQPVLCGAHEFVRALSLVADVFFVSAVPYTGKPFLITEVLRTAAARGFPRGARRKHFAWHQKGSGASRYPVG